MPRKVPTEKQERPHYISADGKLDFSKIFKHQPKQTELLRNVNRNGGLYVQAAAAQNLSVGGIRSGKTSGWLMFFVQHYCMKFAGCDILVLRRTFKELESGAIADFKAFMPKELYEYDQTKHVATLTNGSRIVFGHCQNNKERDIEQYLGQAFPGILVDECGQFSPDAWQMLYARNLVNANCKADELGNFPIPCIVGCSNPLGPFYEYYRTVFIEKKPWLAPEEARRDDSNGTWWVHENGEWHLIYNPTDYAYQRSTVMDNPEMLKRDPGIIARLNGLPKAKRDKMLLGLDGRFEGQYFDIFSEDYHTVNLREDPEAIIWQMHQPVWGGQDWGMGHANATYLFTKALVKKLDGDYALKTVCFQEIVTTGGKSYKELAAIIAMKARLPNGTPVQVKTLHFSHEKFNKQMDVHAPVVEYAKELKQYASLGHIAVVKGTQDRISSASFMYNKFKNGELVITDNCKEIILAIPGLMRNPDMLDDVLKTTAKGDDCYDGFRLGIFGELSAKKRPDIEAIKAHADTLSPIAKHFYLMKQLSDRQNANTPFVQPKQPVWVEKMRNA
jgi:hypothetical protein